MSNQINIKRRILELVEKLDKGISKYSILEMSEIFQKEIDGHDKQVKEEEDKTIKEFKNIYLKVFTSDGGLFGDELEIFYITTIEPECYNTDYIRMYKCKGLRTSFNDLNVSKRGLGGNVHDLKSEKELRGMTVIAKEEYDKYEEKYQSFKDLLKDIVKK